VPEIVPVELTLPSGTWFTLHQRGWEDADDDSLAFLGGDDEVYVFATADDLASYVASDVDAVHHLSDSALWREVRRRPRRAFVPAPEDRYDLTARDDRSKELLSELLGYLRMEAPTGDWNAEPFAALLPPRVSYTGIPVGAPDPRPTGGRTLWGWALAEVDSRIEVPGELAVAPAEVLAPGVESLWLGVDGSGAHTLVHRAEDGTGWTFLGAPGELLAATSVESLRSFVCLGGDVATSVAPWSAFAGHSDVDLEPYEDNIVDLDELGGTLSPQLDTATATALLDVWALIRELATWLELDDVIGAFSEEQPLGRFFVRDLLDVVGGSWSAGNRLQHVDFTELVESWTACTASIAARIRWID
jgi:hypothetical protein